MKAGDNTSGYRILRDFTTAGGGLGRELRKGDPEFVKEIRYGFVGGALMIGLGIAFLFVKDEPEENND
jgi:hypothetical protein